MVLICPHAVYSSASTPVSSQTIARNVRDLVLALRDIALESIVAHTHSMHDGMVRQLVMLQREMTNQISAVRVKMRLKRRPQAVYANATVIIYKN